MNLAGEPRPPIARIVTPRYTQKKSAKSALERRCSRGTDYRRNFLEQTFVQTLYFALSSLYRQADYLPEFSRRSFCSLSRRCSSSGSSRAASAILLMLVMLVSVSAMKILHICILWKMAALRRTPAIIFIKRSALALGPRSLRD